MYSSVLLIIWARIFWMKRGPICAFRVFCMRFFECLTHTKAPRITVQIEPFTFEWQRKWSAVCGFFSRRSSGKPAKGAVWISCVNGLSPFALANLEKRSYTELVDIQSFIYGISLDLCPSRALWFQSMLFRCRFFKAYFWFMKFLVFSSLHQSSSFLFYLMIHHTERATEWRPVWPRCVGWCFRRCTFHNSTLCVFGISFIPRELSHFAFV